MTGHDHRFGQASPMVAQASRLRSGETMGNHVSGLDLIHKELITDMYYDMYYVKT